jgi:hypothetical protein
MKTALILFTSLILLIADSSGLFAQDSGVHATFRLSGVSLRSSLDSLMKWFPVFIVYLDRDVEGKIAAASCTDCRAEEALDRILAGTSLFWTRQGSQYVLRVREPQRAWSLATLSGTVRDSLTGEPVPGAAVLIQDSAGQDINTIRRWCPANPYGFYSLRRLPEGSYTLAVRALGYQAALVPVVVTSDSPVRCDILLSQHDITLQEITIEGERTVLTSAEGIARGVYIRSTPSDRNNYLLDGARIYNPSHFGGVLSTFNGETLNDVQAVVGGLPPNYGGDIGGILDLSVREGNIERLSGTAGTGSLGSHVSLEGPFSRSMTFLASMRRGYPDAAIPFLWSHGTPSRLGSYETIAKVTQRLSGSSSISLSGYLGGDSYTNAVENAGERLYNDFSWGNKMVNIRWLDIASPSLFLNASADYTRYDFTLGQSLMGDTRFPSGLRLPSWYAIEDASVSANAEHYYDEEHTLRAGVELTHHRLAGSIDEFTTQIAPLSLKSTSSWESSVYLQDQWLVLPQVMAELGGRATSYTGEGGSFSAIDPRFSLLVSLDQRTRIYSSLTAINQFIHPYRNSGVFIFYPAIFWYPPTDQARPSTSVQVTLGLEKALSGDAVVASVESFYRSTHNLHEFVFDTTGQPSTDLYNAVILGTGTVYGLEVSLRKRAGDLSGSLTYSLSWANQKFADLNGGQPFVPRFDRRHELQIDLSYTPLENWTFGFLCVLASDLPQSTPERITGSRVTLNNRVRPDSNAVSVSSAQATQIFDVNGSRIPGFQRLELNVARTLSLWGVRCQISLRMLNGFGLLDPFIWALRNSPDVRSKWGITLQEPDIFPLYPSLGLTVRF